MTGRAGPPRKLRNRVDPKVRIIEAAVRGDALQLETLLSQRSDPDFDEFLALQFAARHGQADAVRLLIPFCDPSAQNSLALVLAAESGHANCLNLLMPVSSGEGHLFKALCRALLNGRIECVKILLPVANPHAEAQGLLGLAMASGNPSCVTALLSHPGLRSLCLLDEAMDAALLILAQAKAIPALAIMIELDALEGSVALKSPGGGSQSKRL